MSLQAIKYSRGKLEILNQLLLPGQSIYENVTCVEDGWHAIKDMKVRGAPAIAIVGALSLAVELLPVEFTSGDEIRRTVKEKMEYVKSARPTAVNITEATISLVKFVEKLQSQNIEASDMKLKLIEKIEKMLEKDVVDNKCMGMFGAKHMLNKVGDRKLKILTHCNTGSLATAGYGTALGVIRALHEMDRIDQVFCTETRPYNQGARLTAYELVHDAIPGTLLADSMVSMAMRDKKIDAVVVGADRIVSNGDVANKIGTYQVAITAKYHGIPFYVAAPVTTIDMSLPCGANIVIEERSKTELTHMHGKCIAAPGIEVWNPAFDVTPAELVTGGIVTELGVMEPSELKEKLSRVNP